MYSSVDTYVLASGNVSTRVVETYALGSGYVCTEQWKRFHLSGRNTATHFIYPRFFVDENRRMVI